jgi:hypothetical protein
LRELAQIPDFTAHEHPARHLRIASVKLGELTEVKLAKQLPSSQDQHRIKPLDEIDDLDFLGDDPDD